MKYLSCYLSSVAVLATVSAGHANQVPQMEPTAPVFYVNSPPAPQEIGRRTPRTRGAGGEAAPLGGAPRPQQAALCPNLNETLRAICDDGIAVAGKPEGIGSDYVASREGIYFPGADGSVFLPENWKTVTSVADLEKATQGKEAAQQNEEAGRPFWQLEKKAEVVPLPQPRPAEAPKPESYTVYTTERFGPFTVIITKPKPVTVEIPEIVVNLVEVPTIQE
jgi:hypothetical protein